jgi:hypothetical protein
MQIICDPASASIRALSLAEQHRSDSASIASATVGTFTLGLHLVTLN